MSIEASLDRLSALRWKANRPTIGIRSSTTIPSKVAEEKPPRKGAENGKCSEIAGEGKRLESRNPARMKTP